MKNNNWELDPKKFLPRKDAEKLLAVVKLRAESANAKRKTHPGISMANSICPDKGIYFFHKGKSIVSVYHI